MDLIESFRTLRRRWILTLSLILLTLLGTAAAIVKLPWTYTSQSTVVLLASRYGAKVTGGNPYLSFDSSLTLTADVIRRTLIDPRTAEDLARRGYTASYQVVDAPDTSGPVLLITVTGGNKTAVQHTMYGVTNEVSTKLAALQTTVPPMSKIGDLVLAMSPKATLSAGKKARPLAVVLGLGAVLTFAIPQIVEGRAARRRRLDSTSGPNGSKFSNQHSDRVRAVPSRDVAARRAEQRRGLERPAKLGRGFELDDPPAVARRRVR
jgi:hypothetical protein